jgi:hypothetical protein
MRPAKRQRASAITIALRSNRSAAPRFENLANSDPNPPVSQLIGPGLPKTEDVNINVISRMAADTGRRAFRGAQLRPDDYHGLVACGRAAEAGASDGIRASTPRVGPFGGRRCRRRQPCGHDTRPVSFWHECRGPHCRLPMSTRVQVRAVLERAMVPAALHSWWG